MKSHKKSLPVRSRKAVTTSLAAAHKGAKKPAVAQRSGGLASAAVQKELNHFESRQQLLTAEYAFLKCLPVPAKCRAKHSAKMQDLRARNQELMLDLIGWMMKHRAA